MVSSPFAPWKRCGGNGNVCLICRSDKASWFCCVLACMFALVEHSMCDVLVHSILSSFLTTGACKVTHQTKFPFLFLLSLAFMYQVHIFIARFTSQTILYTFTLLTEHLFIVYLLHHTNLLTNLWKNTRLVPHQALMKFQAETSISFSTPRLKGSYQLAL